MARIKCICKHYAITHEVKADGSAPCLARGCKCLDARWDKPQPPIEQAPLAPVFIPPRPPRRLFAALTTLLFLAAIGGAFVLGHTQGQEAALMRGYDSGRQGARQELARLLLAEQGMLQPIVVPPDADCVTLTLLSARAGALMGLQSISAQLDDPMAVAP